MAKEKDVPVLRVENLCGSERYICEIGGIKYIVSQERYNRMKKQEEKRNAKRN